MTSFIACLLVTFAAAIGGSLLIDALAAPEAVRDGGLVLLLVLNACYRHAAYAALPIASAYFVFAFMERRAALETAALLAMSALLTFWSHWESGLGHLNLGGVDYVADGAPTPALYLRNLALAAGPYLVWRLLAAAAFARSSTTVTTDAGIRH